MIECSHDHSVSTAGDSPKGKDAMELRLLRYFLTVAQEENVTRAAVKLHTSQPNLTRQLTILENELGCKLLNRSRKRVTLTEEGAYLRKQAQAILELSDATEQTVKSFDSMQEGEVRIGAAETKAMRYVGSVVQKTMTKYPGIRFHIGSGNTADITEKLDMGIFDFAILIEPVDRAKYCVVELPEKDAWGFLIPREDRISESDGVEAEDIIGKAVLFPLEGLTDPSIRNWAGTRWDDINVAITFNLATTPGMMAEGGAGYVLTLEGLRAETPYSPLVFRPLSPPQYIALSLAYRRYDPLPKPARLFLEEFEREIDVL